MTIKDILQSYESEIVIIFALLIGAVIAVKVLSVIVHSLKRAGTSGRGESDDGEYSKTGTTVTVNGFLVSDEHLSITGIDAKTAAFIVAVIAHESELKADELIIRSIKEAD